MSSGKKRKIGKQEASEEKTKKVEKPKEEQEEKAQEEIDYDDAKQMEKFLGGNSRDWKKNYGKRIIVEAYETPALGHIWLIAKQKASEKRIGYHYGLVKMYDAEWGMIEVEQLREMSKKVSFESPIKIFKDILPCTLAKLFEETEIHTFFD